MKRRTLALLFALLLCCASVARADVRARDGAGLPLSPGEALAPGSTLRIAFALEALPESPALRLRLAGMTLVSVSFQTKSATRQPVVIYGSDGCVFLFAGPVRAGDTIYLEALLRDSPGEAAAALLLRGEPWMEFPCVAAVEGLPDAALVPAMAAAVPEADAAAEAPPAETPGGRWALVLLCVFGLGAAGCACILRPRLRAGEKRDDASG